MFGPADRFGLIDGEPCIFLTLDATESVIAHEVLHGNLRAHGFVAPDVKFQFNKKDEFLLKRVHVQLANVIEHKMMFPRFKSLGLNEKDFLGLKDCDISGVVIRVKERREPENVILRAYIATIYVELAADYASASGAAQQLTSSLRNDVYPLFRVCQLLTKHLDESAVSSPDAYAIVFTECFSVLGIKIVADN